MITATWAAPWWPSNSAAKSDSPRRATGPRRLVLALVVAAGVGSSGCAPMRQVLGRELVPVATEVELGQSLAKQIEAEYTVASDPELQSYVRFLAQPLIEQARVDRPDIDYRITVLDDPQQVNAFALPGGPMYVFTGLLALAEDEAEVVGVLSHELGHVVARHSANQLGTQFGVQVLMSMALGEDPAQLAELAGQLAGAGAMARFGRDDERQADDYGVKYTAGAGYDPRGLIDLFAKMDSGERAGSFAKLLASHPATDERIARIEGRIAKLPPGGERHAERYLRMTATLR